MSLMKGKKGLIMGVANERSIAWGISQILAEAGAELAFTYLGEALKKRVVPLAKSLNSEFTLSCNVENKEEIPRISSTKSLSGHPLGAASVHEAIYCLIMMKNNFIAGSANINEMDEEAKKFPIVKNTEKEVNLNAVMSNSFGFGGTNAALIFEKV